MKAVVALVALGAIAHADPLAVEVKPATKVWHAGKPVDVALRVVNASATTQTFLAMNCSWEEHWKSGDPELVWDGWACAKNFAATVELAPGKAYEKTLAMHPTAAAALGRHTLRLSFTPQGGATTWSAPVVIEVAR